MEASAAGLAAGGEAQGEAQQGQGEQQGQQPTGDAAVAAFGDQLTALQSSIAGMGDTQEQMRQWLAGQAQQAADAQTQQTQQQQQPDLTFLETETDPAVAAQRLQQVINESASTQAQQLIEQRLAPLQEQLQSVRLNQEADALVAEFPDLGNPEIAKSVMASANQLAEMIGQPELSANTAFVRTVYMAGRAAQMQQQQQEGAATAPGAATLEGGSGAGPAAQQGGETADTIAEGWARRSSVLPKF